MAFLGFDNTSLKWYLHGRIQSLNVEGITSAALEIKNGVPQGSILGLLLSSFLCRRHNSVHFWNLC